MLRLSVVAALASCGGGDAAAPSAPETPIAAPPASLVLQTGDGQSALPGRTLSVAPAVAVRDANGRAVANSAVTFAVVSGGGSVANATATTDSQGTATSGGWTIGRSGDQLLEARLGTLPVVRFAATISTGLVQSEIPPSGGTLEITTPEHPYRGLTLTIPDGAFPGSGTWRIELAPDAPPPSLPTGFSVSGPALRVETDQARAARLMTLRVPLPRVAGAARFVVATDPTRAVRELLPVVAADSAGITVMIGHLNASLLIGRSASPFAEASSQRTAFSATSLYLYPLTAVLNALGLTGTSLLNFLDDAFPGSDLGSYSYPIGHGPAIALINMFGQLSNQSLAGLVRLTPFGALADTAAFATLQLIADYHHRSSSVRQSLSDFSAALASTPVATRDSLAAINLWGGLALSGLPQLMMFEERFGASPGRRTFATMFGVANGITRFSSAASPTSASALTLGAGGFSARVDKEVVDAMPIAAEGVLPLGGSFVYPIEEPRGLYAAMLAALAKQGAARQQANAALAAQAGLPAVTLEVQGATSGEWAPADTLIVIRDSSATVRASCVGCTNALPQTSLLFAGAPATSLVLGSLGVGDLQGVALSRFDPTQVFSTLASAYRPVVPLHVRLAMALFRTSPDSQLVTADSLVQFSATVDLPPPRGYVIDWDFGDSSAVMRVSDAVGASHRYTTPGAYVVKATLRNGPNALAPNVLLATSTSKVVVKALPIWAGWRVTSLSTNVEDQYRHRIVPGTNLSYWEIFQSQAQQDANPTKRNFVTQVATDESLLQRISTNATPAAIIFLARDTAGINSFVLTRGVYLVSGVNVPPVSRVLPQGLDRYSTGLALSVLPFDNPASQMSCNPIFGWNYSQGGQLLTGSGMVVGSTWSYPVIGTSIFQLEPLRATMLNLTVTGDTAVGTIVYKYRLSGFCGNGVEEQNPWFVTATFAATRIK